MIYQLTGAQGLPLPWRFLRGPWPELHDAVRAASDLIEAGLSLEVQLWRGGTHLATFTKRHEWRHG